MDTHQFLLALLLILLFARLFAEVATRLRIPAVLGELLAGVILGPSLFGWIEPVEALRLLAEIGIILLLFEVGLDVDVQKLARAGWRSAIVAIAGFVLPFVFGYGLTRHVFALGTLESLFVGGALTATSIGITVRVMRDIHVQNTREGQIVLGAAVLDDIFGVILLALLYEFATAGVVSLNNASKVGAFILVFFLIAPIAAKFMALVIGRLDHSTELPGLIPTAMVSLVLLFAWLAKEVGAPEMLGGFAAGLALSRRFFLPFGLSLRTDENLARRIEHQMEPIIRLFTPIFFVTVGLSLNLHAVDWHSSTIWLLTGGLLIVAVLGKLLGGLIVLSLPLASRTAVGIAMIPRGEVGLVFAELGRTSGMLSDETYAAILLVVAFTTLLSPLILKGFYARFSDAIHARSPHAHAHHVHDGDG